MARRLTKENIQSESLRNHKGCWLWPGKSPYGPIRRAYRLFKGDIPKGINTHVMHSCDTPKCINPAHLSIGTRQDNMIDCRDKDRLNNVWIKYRAKKPLCPRGHPYSGANLILRKDRPGRECRACKKIHRQKWLDKQ